MKKMRRLIPAVAMLMVAAVMLSTASFAWFTMNDVVTASGMQVQAKAAGNLLISTQKMTASAKDISVDFTQVAKKNLKPITYVAPADENADGKWQAVGTSTVVDPLLGTYTGALVDVTDLSTEGAKDYFYEQVVFLATAGTEYTAPVEMDIEALVGADEKIAPAYTVAILVGDNTDWTDPDIVYNYKTRAANVAAANPTFVKTEGSYLIPSTYGTTDATAVGLKVTIRIYVDGDLDGGKVTIKSRNLVAMDYSTSTKFDAVKMANWTFYSTNNENAVVDKAAFTADTDLKELGITYYWDSVETEDYNPWLSQEKDAKYVNNDNVPVIGTTFSVSFKAQDPNTND